MSEVRASARNRLPGTVVRVRLGEVVAQVTIRVGRQLVDAVITRESAEEMGLAKGDRVRLVLEALERLLHLEQGLVLLALARQLRRLHHQLLRPLLAAPGQQAVAPAGADPVHRGRAALAGLRRLVGGDTRVTFGGEVSGEAVPALLGTWDLLCCPSRSLEGGPTVALEAFAVGTPVVGSRIGGLAELVTERTGALVPAGDVFALRDLLARIASSPADTIDLWRAAIGPVRTMDDVTEDYLEMYLAR